MFSEKSGRVLFTSDNKYAIVLYTYSIGVFSLEEKKQIYKIETNRLEGIMG